MTAPSPQQADLQSEIRRLVIMWGSCCISPILYLGVAWFIKHNFMEDNSGFFPLPADYWSQALIGMVLLIIVLQGLHLLIKHRYRAKLAAVYGSTETFIQVLTRRSLILIFISEMAVFTGFCLFILQGNLAVVFGSGLAAMFLYAQSHPRSSLPTQ